MRVMGIDPGMVRLGLACVEVLDGTVDLVTYGMISHPRDASLTFNEHLAAGIHQLADDLPKFIGMTNPDYIAMELVPVGRLGSNDALVIAAASSCRLIAYQFGIPVLNLAATTVKKELTGDGKATKVKIRNTITSAFSNIDERHKLIKQQQKEAGEKPEGLPADIFDACAIAVIGAKRINEQKSSDL